MGKNTVLSINFNKEEIDKIGKAYFKFEERAKTPLHDFAINKGEIYVMYQLITKYLYKKYGDVDYIKQLLKRHLAIVLYYCIYKETIDAKDSRFLMTAGELIGNKESSELDGYFATLYSCDITDYKQISKCLKEIKKKAREEKLSENAIDGIDVAASTILDYFGYKNRCIGIDFVKRFDLMIAKEINNPTANEEFSFEFKDDVEVLKSLWSTNKKVVGLSKKYVAPLLGFVINKIFELGYKQFNDEQVLYFNKGIYYKTVLFKGDLYLKDFVFLETATNDKQAKRINIDKIIEFNFTYNNKKYRFTKEGIIDR